MLAAVKACGPGAVLSHWSAAELWGFVDEQGRQPHVTVVGSATRLLPGVAVHRTAALDSRDRARYRGVPVTAAARTLLDLAAVGGTEVTAAPCERHRARGGSTSVSCSRSSIGSDLGAEAEGLRA
jgi:predicted transcriptional regulator of viral defense system